MVHKYISTFMIINIHEILHHVHVFEFGSLTLHTMCVCLLDSSTGT